MNNDPYCLNDGHPRGYHVETMMYGRDPTVDPDERLLVCKHPAHGTAPVVCGSEEACFPEVAALRARTRARPSLPCSPSPDEPSRPPTRSSVG